MFQLELSNRFLPLSDVFPSDVQELSDEVSNNTTETAEKLFPPLKSPKSTWMHQDTIKAINEKNVVRKVHGDSSIPYRVAKAINQINDDHDEISNPPPDKQFFLAMKKLKTHKRNISWGIKDKNGKILTSKEDILERWATLYEEFYDDPNNCELGKSPGLDSIYSEFLKAGGDDMVEILHVLINLILETGVIPSSFKKALIVVLYKKDDRSECKNYRPISLLSHIYKLFMTIIGGRITNDLYSCLPDSINRIEKRQNKFLHSAK